MSRNFKLSLIDSHCDTAFELYHKKQGLAHNDCHVSLEKAQRYDKYAQFFAVWADRRRSDDECFEDFIKINDNLFAEIEKNCDKVSFVRTFGEMRAAWDSGKRAIFLAVEDARILGGRIERLDVLRERGVKYLTLLWGGDTCIGASHDREGGLTDFGREVVERCFELGMLPDVSHASEQVTDEVSDIAKRYKKPFIASHSNCYEQYAHTRNLRKRHLDDIITLGGFVGVSLCPPHLVDMSQGHCTVSDVCDHIDRYIELGAIDVLGLGCDLDGTGLPEGFSGIADLYKIADELLARGHSQQTVEKIFYKNYLSFIENNF